MADYHHLLYVWTVVRDGSISKAAEKLRLTQPTISAQVRRAGRGRLERASRIRLVQVSASQTWTENCDITPDCDVVIP